MKQVVIFVVTAVAVAGCDLIKLDQGQGTTTASGTGGASATTTAFQGGGCAVDANTGVTLCTTLSACAGFAIDHEVFPDCGFRVNGTAIDVECSCSGQLCPLGTTTTCADAQSLLGQVTEQVVCSQISDGRCVDHTTKTTVPPSNSTCDTACRTDCGGDPTCLVACGC